MTPEPQRDRYWKMSNANPARRRARLESQIPADRSGCWTWNGTRLLNGYGVIRAGQGSGPNARWYVHRVSYETFVGPIADGLVIDHLCRNRACFNPAHLEAVTNAENVRRGWGSLDPDSARTHCKRGHPTIPANIRSSPDGSRRCRPCDLAWQRARLARQRTA